MQQPPQDPNQHNQPSSVPDQSPQGFVPDPAYAPASTIGDDVYLDPQESIEDVVKNIEKKDKITSLVISVAMTSLIMVLLYSPIFQQLT